MANKSDGLSTTQSVPLLRTGFSQIPHTSVSEKFWQLSQRRTFSIALLKASDNRVPPERARSSKWKAMRWAVFWPTPGKHLRDSTSSSTSGLNAMKHPQTADQNRVFKTAF